MSRFFSNRFANLVPYTPGEQPRDMQYIKLNTNESPFPPHPAVAEAVAAEAGLLQLSPQCKDAIREFSLYTWQEGEDRPVKENDHAMDDIRYFCATVLRREEKFTERLEKCNEKMAM